MDSDEMRITWRSLPEDSRFNYGGPFDPETSILMIAEGSLGVIGVRIWEGHWRAALSAAFNSPLRVREIVSDWNECAGVFDRDDCKFYVDLSPLRELGKCGFFLDKRVLDLFDSGGAWLTLD